MISITDLVPLPSALKGERDRLRVVGYELVKYSELHSRSKANFYRHPWRDYVFGIHRIEHIYEDGVVWINPHPFYSSEDRLCDWVKYHLEKENVNGYAAVRSWFTDPASLALTIIVPPFALATLGMGLLGLRSERKAREERGRRLALLADMPKVWNKRAV